MKDPNYIETSFQVTENGSPIDSHDNFHKTLEEAFEYAGNLTHFKGCEYEVEEVTVVTTIHKLPFPTNN